MTHLFNNLDEFMDAKYNIYMLNENQLIERFFDIYEYLKFNAHINNKYENEEFYHRKYQEQIKNLYGYDIYSLEYINTIKTMCFLKDLNIVINWEQFFIDNMDFTSEDYFFNNPPIYYFNIIKIIEDMNIDNNIYNINSFINITVYNEYMLNNDINAIYYVDYNKYYYDIFWGIIICLIDKGLIFDMDVFFTPIDFVNNNNDNDEFLTYEFDKILKALILDYILYDNTKLSLIKLRFLKSKYITNINIINSNIKLILENNLIDDLSNIVTQYNQLTIYDIIQLYVEKYGGWENILEVYLNTNNFNDEKYLLMFSTIKYYSNYLREKYHKER